MENKSINFDDPSGMHISDFELYNGVGVLWSVFPP